MIRNNYKNSNSKKTKSIFHHFCPGLPVPLTLCPIKQCGTWSCGGFCPQVRRGCIACSRGQGGFQCGEDVYPSNHAQRTVEILQLPFCKVDPPPNDAPWPKFYTAKMIYKSGIASPANIISLMLHTYVHPSKLQILMN